MSEHKIEKCSLPKPKTRNLGYVAACLTCHKLHILRWKSYIRDLPRAGGHFYWEEVEGKK